MKFFSSLIVSAVLCGCAHGHAHRPDVTGHGDAGRFILRTAMRYGGVPITSNGLPFISDQWRYFEDDGGTVITLSSAKLPVVESFLRKSFGQPAGGQPGHGGYYRLTERGGGIMFTEGENSEGKTTQVIILRPPPVTRHSTKS